MPSPLALYTVLTFAQLAKGPTNSSMLPEGLVVTGGGAPLLTMGHHQTSNRARSRSGARR